MQPIIIVHGGAGDINDARVPGKLAGVKIAVKTGYQALLDGGSALDAVEQAVRSMELDDNFNAGYGAVLNWEGNIELEASVMEGSNLNAGCVTLLKNIVHPISVARKVMENTNHTFLGGESAIHFAKEQGFEILPNGSLVTENARLALKEFKALKQLGKDTTFARTELDEVVSSVPGEPGTVGAVAIDKDGNIAAATSTGGITGKIPGRIGDTPLLGSGTYADNLIGGVSTTGHGETIMRYNLAQRILQKIKYDEVNTQSAAEDTVEKMTERLVGTGGAIVIDRNGNIGIAWSSKRMSWAYIKDEKLAWGIDHGQTFKEEYKL